MQQLSGGTAVGGEVAELEMACAKAESLLLQVLGEDLVLGKTAGSDTGNGTAEGVEEAGGTQGAGCVLLHCKVEVMQARHRVPVRAAGRSVWKGRMNWSKL